MGRFSKRLAFLLGTAAFSLVAAGQVAAQGDLFMRDTATDSGAEPYAGPGPVYLSPDIWVRKDPDPNFQPYPYNTSSPPWTPAAHQNPEYRDSKTARPNYVYVRIHNRGRTASSGNERLRLNQAKASTGLAWPAAWVDNMANACGQELLHGIEITKPRVNAKDASAAERLDYRDAVIAIASDPAYTYNDGMQYFTKQNVVHISGPEHGNPAFFPWHREMVNRYEERLKEHNPLVRLLYWDFTQDPRTGTSLHTNSFMGASNGTVTGPLGAALPTTVSRDVGGTATDFTGMIVCALSEFNSDSFLNGSSGYSTLRSNAESTPNHNCAHGYIGGYTASAGPISDGATAVQDPFFFLLHANVDRQWANWQRDGADPSRVDPVAAFGTNSSNSRITANMRPWDGTFSVAPWTGAGVTPKTSKNPSVVFPPIYDTAPLNIPVLQPGESVVIEIPWFPPNVNNYDCAGQAGHFCLLARIETDTNPPFGMTTAETTSVSANTRNNNNIVWKNLTIVDTEVEPLFFVTGTTIHNIFDREAFFRIRLVDRTAKRRFLLQEFADLAIGIPDDILERVLEGKTKLRDLETGEIKGLDRKVLRITGKEPEFRLLMKPDERFTAEFAVRLRDEKPVRAILEEPFLFDIEQVLDIPRDMFNRREAEALDVGGVRFEIDFTRLLEGKDRANDDVKLAGLTLNLGVDRLRNLKSLDSSIVENVHLSPGEPLQLTVEDDEPNKPMLQMSLEVDGERIAETKEGRLSETVRFEKPGVHVIETRGLSSDGELVQRRVRVLVSEDIPPIVAILSPEPGASFKLGENIAVLAETSAAFETSVKEVTLHAKEGMSFLTGFDLVNENYPAVDRSEGDGPHEMIFKPETPGRYMLQIGASGDDGNVGVSGQVMVTVTE